MCILRSAELDRAPHAFEQKRSFAIVDVNFRAKLRLEIGRSSDEGSEEFAAVEKRCVSKRHLDGRNLQKHAFAHCALESPTATRQQTGGFLVIIDSGRMAEAKIGERLCEIVFVESFANGREVIVARVGQRFSRIERRSEERRVGKEGRSRW